MVICAPWLSCVIIPDKKPGIAQDFPVPAHHRKPFRTGVRI